MNKNRNNEQALRWLDKHLTTVQLNIDNLRLQADYVFGDDEDEDAEIFYRAVRDLQAAAEMVQVLLEYNYKQYLKTRQDLAAKNPLNKVAK